MLFCCRAWVGYFKLSYCKSYECIQKPKSGCRRGWLSEAEAPLALSLLFSSLSPSFLCLCRIITSLIIILTDPFAHSNFIHLFPASTEIIRAERINIRDVSTNSATLHWRPVLSGLGGYYEIHFGPLPTGGGGDGGDGTGTSPSTSSRPFQRLTPSADSSTARLTGLKPDTTYTTTLTPKYNEQVFNKLSVTFKTKPGWVTSYLQCYNPYIPKKFLKFKNVLLFLLHLLSLYL